MKLIVTATHFENYFIKNHFTSKNEIKIFNYKKFNTNIVEFDDFLLAQVGIGNIISLIALQKIFDNYQITSVLTIGSGCSISENVNKIVFINSFYFLSNYQIENFFSLNLNMTNEIKQFLKKFDIQTFSNYSAPFVINSDNYLHLFEINKNICLDMELSYWASVFNINKIPFYSFKVITDSGKSNFEEIKNIYNSKETELVNIIKYFLKI